MVLPLAREAAAPPPGLQSGDAVHESGGFPGCRRRVGIVLPDLPGPRPGPWWGKADRTQRAAHYAAPRQPSPPRSARGKLNAPSAPRAA